MNHAYWQSDEAARGLFFLRVAEGCMRLLVPLSQRRHLLEMTQGVREVVLTRGQYQGADDVCEVMFEDRGLTPFVLYLDQTRLERRWTTEEEERRWRFAIHTPNGLVTEIPRCWLRSEATLPCLRSRGAAEAGARIARTPEP